MQISDTIALNIPKAVLLLIRSLKKILVNIQPAMILMVMSKKNKPMPIKKPKSDFEIISRIFKSMLLNQSII